MFECHWKSTYGVECFGCGFQRSIALLFEGKFLESISLYPATIPLIVTILYVILHLKLSFKKGARNIIILFSFTTFLMLANFIWKLIF